MRKSTIINEIVDLFIENNYYNNDNKIDQTDSKKIKDILKKIESVNDLIFLKEQLKKTVSNSYRGGYVAGENIDWNVK